MRIIYFCLGWVMVALGVIGLVLPLMPGAVFLIVAAWCFARSSPRFEAWLLEHPTLGKPLRDWRAAGAIPRPAKIMACAGMAFGFAVFCYTFRAVSAARPGRGGGFPGLRRLRRLASGGGPAGHFDLAIAATSTMASACQS